MNVLYVGNDEGLKAFGKTPKKYGIQLEFFYAVTKLKKEILDYILDNDFDGIIFNADEMLTSYNDIPEIISIIADEKDVRICLLCPGTTPDDELLFNCVKAGAEYFMPYVNFESNIKVLELLKKGKTNAFEFFGIATPITNENEEKKELMPAKKKKERAKRPKKEKITESMPIEEIAPAVIPEADVPTLDIKEEPISDFVETPIDIIENVFEVTETIPDNSKIIAISSCLPRMGATTLSIQIIKYLLTKGKKACYFDFTNTDYMDDFILVYNNEGTLNENEQLFELDGIPFYYKGNAQTLEKISDSGYDYIVIDMGAYSALSEPQKAIFDEADYRLMCCGSKPNEVKALYNVMDDIIKHKTYYMFYSVPVIQRDSINNTCNHDNQICCYVPYINDEFELQENTYGLFNCIFKFDDISEV